MKSIALKLWLAMMALVVMVLLLLWLFQIVFLDSFYMQIRINDIRKSGVEILEVLENGTLTEFQERLDQLTYSKNLMGELIDTQQQTVYTSGTMGMNGQMPMIRNNIRNDVYGKVLKGQDVSVQMTHPRFGSSFMLIGIPIIIKNDIQGALVLTLPIESVNDTVEILKVQLLYITLILLVLAVVIAFLLSKSFTRPILDIIKISMTMAKGDFSARVSLKRKDEIGRLGEAINHMGDELSRVEQLRRDLIANVSHELRTPLSLIKGYAETVRDVTGGIPEKRQKHLGIIIDESNRLSEMVNEILDFSQMQSGYVKLNKQVFKINDTVEKVYRNFEVLCNNAGVSFVLNNDDEALTLADESKLEQVLYNLLNNALNHCTDGDSITLSLQKTYEVSRNVQDAQPTTIKIVVEDSGEGISQSELPYIWDRFYKVDKSGNRKRAGTGLGLAIVKNILEAHGFKYGVSSIEGVGTKFWFEVNRIKK